MKSNIGEDLFKEAYQIINGDRLDSYGSPENSFLDIASRWEQHVLRKLNKFDIAIVLLQGKLITPQDVALMMVDLKIARELNKPKKDNVVDICGYCGLYLNLITKTEK